MPILRNFRIKRSISVNLNNRITKLTVNIVRNINVTHVQNHKVAVRTRVKVLSDQETLCFYFVQV